MALAPAHLGVDLIVLLAGHGLLASSSSGADNNDGQPGPPKQCPAHPPPARTLCRTWLHWETVTSTITETIIVPLSVTVSFTSWTTASMDKTLTFTFTGTVSLPNSVDLQSSYISPNFVEQVISTTSTSVNYNTVSVTQMLIVTTSATTVTYTPTVAKTKTSFLTPATSVYTVTTTKIFEVGPNVKVTNTVYSRTPISQVFTPTLTTDASPASTVVLGKTRAVPEMAGVDVTSSGTVQALPTTVDVSETTTAAAVEVAGSVISSTLIAASEVLFTSTQTEVVWVERSAVCFGNGGGSSGPDSPEDEGHGGEAPGHGNYGSPPTGGHAPFELEPSPLLELPGMSASPVPAEHNSALGA